MNYLSKYNFGFTAASLRLNETINIERAFRKGGYSAYEEILNKEELIGKGNKRTSIREFRELTNRLKTLTTKQKDVLVNGDLVSQKQIAFLGACKNYRIIREFVLDVLREKILVFDYQLTESDYLIFERKKPEVEQLAVTTRKKVKQVLLKIIEQAGLIDNNVRQMIQPQLLQQQVADIIMEDSPDWLKVFLYSDPAIQKLKQTYGKY